MRPPGALRLPRRAPLGAGAAARRRAPGARALLPGQPRPGRRRRRTVVVIHDLAALRHPGWYSPVYASYQQQILPLLARRARLVIAPSEFSRHELVDGPRRSTRTASRSCRNGVDERFSPSADPEPVRRAYGLERPYVLVVGTRIARKNLASLDDGRARRLREHGIELVSAGSGRAYMRPGETPADARARLRGRPAPARPLRRGAGAGDAVSLRGLRAAGARGDGERRAGGGRRPHGAAGDVRRRRAAGRPRRRRARSPTRWCSATERRRRARAADRRRPGARRAVQLGPQRPADRRGDRAGARAGRADRAAARDRRRPTTRRADRRGRLDDHRQPRAPRPAPDLPRVARARAAARSTRTPS